MKINFFEFYNSNFVCLKIGFIECSEKSVKNKKEKHLKTGAKDSYWPICGKVHGLTKNFI
jgi:hypothetical protein